MKAYRITMTVDHGWLNAITEMCSYVEDGEICVWESVSDPFEVNEKIYNITEEEFQDLIK
jgi:hypothetical protein